MSEPGAPEPRFTEGVMSDGACIICDGYPMTITEVLDVLNARRSPVAISEDAVERALHGADYIPNDDNRKWMRAALAAALVSPAVTAPVAVSEAIEECARIVDRAAEACEAGATTMTEPFHMKQRGQLCRQLASAIRATALVPIASAEPVAWTKRSDINRLAIGELGVMSPRKDSRAFYDIPLYALPIASAGEPASKQDEPIANPTKLPPCGSCDWFEPNGTRYGGVCTGPESKWLNLIVSCLKDDETCHSKLQAR